MDVELTDSLTISINGKEIKNQDPQLAKEEIHEEIATQDMLDTQEDLTETNFNVADNIAKYEKLDNEAKNKKLLDRQVTPDKTYESIENQIDRNKMIPEKINPKP